MKSEHPVTQDDQSAIDRRRDDLLVQIRDGFKELAQHQLGSDLRADWHSHDGSEGWRVCGCQLGLPGRFCALAEQAVATLLPEGGSGDGMARWLEHLRKMRPDTFSAPFNDPRMTLVGAAIATDREPIYADDFQIGSINNVAQVSVDVLETLRAGELKKEFANANIAHQKVLFPEGVPGDTDIQDLVVRLNAEHAKPEKERRTKIDIARDYLGNVKNRDARARKLLSRIRKMKSDGKVNL